MIQRPDLKHPAKISELFLVSLLRAGSSSDPVVVGIEVHEEGGLIQQLLAQGSEVPQRNVQRMSHSGAD